MKNRTLATGLAAMALAVGLTLAFPAPSRADTLPEGLYVGEYSLGGMTEEEARDGESEDYAGSGWRVRGYYGEGTGLSLVQYRRGKPGRGIRNGREFNPPLFKLERHRT